MPEQQSFTNFARKDDLGKINLSDQINRTATLLSSRLESGNVDIMRSQKILVNAKMNAVDVLGRMIQFYLKMSPYYSKLLKLRKKFKPLMKDNNEHKSTIAKENYAEAKFGMIMEFIALKGWFIEDSAIGVIGSPDDYFKHE